MTGLVERAPELASLRAAVDEARQGRGSLVLVAGEAGAGKTSLLRAARAASEVEFLVGHCEALSVPAPLAPLRGLAEAAGTPALPELDGDDRLALARAPLRSLR